MPPLVLDILVDDQGRPVLEKLQGSEVVSNCLVDPVASLIEQTAAQAHTALLTEHIRFQEMWASMAEANTQFQQLQKELLSPMLLIESRWKEDQERLQQEVLWDFERRNVQTLIQDLQRPTLAIQEYMQNYQAMQMFMAREAQTLSTFRALNAMAAQVPSASQYVADVALRLHADNERARRLLEDNERLQRLATSFQAIDARLQQQTSGALWTPEQYQRLQDENQVSLDIWEVIQTYCLDYREIRPASAQPGGADAARDRLIVRLHPGLRNPRAAKALRHRAAVEHTSPQELLRTVIFPEAIILVSQEAATPQRMRVGRDWATNRQRKVQLASPVKSLPGRAFERWWFSQVYAAATAILLDEGYPKPTIRPVSLLWRTEDALEHLAAPESLGARDSAMLIALLHKEDVDPSEQLHRLLSVASPRERELLMLMYQGLSRKEAARVMGISRSTADVFLYRVRKKSS